jgi:NlpC/P60 family putative phage cell wall peptidase
MTQHLRALSRQDIIEEAKSWIGTPYRHQASCKGAGADCLGLIRGIYRNLYGFEPETPPPYNADWAELADKETLRDAARRHLQEQDPTHRQKGDVLLFRWRKNTCAKHAAIYDGNDRIIHAFEGHGVVSSNFSLWAGKIAHSFSFPTVTD